MKKILIIGGAGFIGSNLLRKLSHKNEITILDNLYTGNSNNIKNQKCIFLYGDINKEIDIENNFDEIYHLASIASPYYYKQDKIKTFDTNIMGTKNVLDFALKNNSKVLVVSSSEVYGTFNKKMSENVLGEVDTIGERSCYTESKRACETISNIYRESYDLDVKIARVFNAYGPHMNFSDKRVIIEFVLKCLRNQDVIIYGDGKQIRSFCYIDDTINGLISLMKSDYTKPINIGNPEEITIFNLFFLIKEKLNSKSDIIYKKRDSDDGLRRCPDISLAKEELQWSPSINLDCGLDLTIKWLKEIR